MKYEDKIRIIKESAKYNPELTDRELSIMLDAAFGECDEAEEDNNN